MSNHDREFELMCLCARLTVGPAAEARIATLVRQDVDWNSLIATAHRQRVLPLLHRTLTRVAAGSVPDEARRLLHAATQENARRCMWLTRELLRILDIFHAHEISCIPYKGPVLALRVYQDLSLRQFSDLDIILPENHVMRARALLLSNGYRSDTDLTETQLRDYIARERDLTLLRDGLRFELEIHWRVTRHWHAIQIPSQMLWEDLDTCSIGGRSVQTHTFEHLLVILCTHAASHAWDRLGWLCDVAEIVRSQNLDWDRAFEHAAAVDGRRILLVGVALAVELLGAEPPPHVQRAIHEDAGLEPLTNQVRVWLSSGAPIALGELELFLMGLRERTSDKVHVGIEQIKRRLVLTSRDTESFPLPYSLKAARYLLRPIRLTREYGLMPLIRFFKGIFQS